MHWERRGVIERNRTEEVNLHASLYYVPILEV